MGATSPDSAHLSVDLPDHGGGAAFHHAVIHKHVGLTLGPIHRPNLSGVEVFNVTGNYCSVGAIPRFSELLVRPFRSGRDKVGILQSMK